MFAHSLAVVTLYFPRTTPVQHHELRKLLYLVLMRHRLRVVRRLLDGHEADYIPPTNESMTLNFASIVTSTVDFASTTARGIPNILTDEPDRKFDGFFTLD